MPALSALAQVLGFLWNYERPGNVSIQRRQDRPIRFRQLHEMSIRNLLGSLHPPRKPRRIEIIRNKYKSNPAARFQPQQGGSRLLHGKSILRKPQDTHESQLGYRASREFILFRPQRLKPARNLFKKLMSLESHGY